MIPLIYDQISGIFDFKLADINHDIYNPFIPFGLDKASCIINGTVKEPALFVFKRQNTSNLNLIRYIMDNKLYKKLPKITLFFSDILTDASGWAKRKWIAPEGNLHLSILLRPEIPLCQKNLVLIRINIINSVIRTLKKLVDEDISIKLPSDILINDKKIGGIIERGYCGFDIKGMVFGIGLNINTLPKVMDIPNKFIKGIDSISNITGKEYDLFGILMDIVDNIILNDHDLDFFNNHLYNLNKEISVYKDQKDPYLIKKGIFKGITPEGYLEFSDSILKTHTSFRIAC